MTLRFCDSFDHYQAEVLDGLESGAGLREKYDRIAVINTGRVATEAGGRFGGRRLMVGPQGPLGGSGHLRRDLGVARATWVAGFAFRTNYYPGAGAYTALLGFTHEPFPGTAGVQCLLFLGPGGYLAVGRPPPAAPLADATYRPPLDAWVYLQFKVTIGTSGAYEVRVYDTPVLTGSGDTQGAASATANGVLVGTLAIQPGGGSALHYDDLYVCDTDGARNNDFLGDTRITCLFPTGAGASAQFTPSAGANYQNVDDPALNLDTDYNASSTPGHKDSFPVGDIADTGSAVRGVQWVATQKKDDAGARAVRRLVRIGGTDYVGGADHVVIDSYRCATEVLETSPATGAAWTVAEVNGAEAGYTLQS